jgi:ketosteroid isomerase-like protein
MPASRTVPGPDLEHGPFRFAFNALFTFGDGRIARVDSYIVALS